MTALNISLVRVAVSARPATKAAAKAALKLAGLKQTLADELLAEQKRLADCRKLAPAARIARHLGYTPVDVTSRRGSWHDPSQPAGRGVKVRQPATAKRTPRMIVRLPSGTPAARLDTLRRAAVKSAYSRIYRVAAHGVVDVKLTTDPADVGIYQVERHSWDYAKSVKSPMRYQDTNIIVPADWRVRVERRGMAVVDGMLTLDVAPMDGAPAGVALFAAVWLVQGRGTTTTPARGYIARAESVSYHGETAEKALAGLRRKIKAAEWSATLRTADLASNVAKAGPADVVCVADAAAIGACDYGIRSWCNAVGLDYAAGCAPLSVVYSAYQSEPRPEARAAILHALRRQRVQIAA